VNISTIYKRACLSFLLVAVVLIFQPCLASGSTQFEDACQLYLRKQYAKALPAFIACLKTDPRNASAYMYVANCYYLLGDKGSATQTYGIIVKGFPGTAEAAAAQKFLTNQQIGKDASSQGAAATRHQ
jgi:tetratricopeptide (TPR) repeat protein